jgi:hypothetical protein
MCRRFDPGGVPGPTSKLSLRAPTQMGWRKTEHKGENRGFVLSCARVGALAVGVTSVRGGGGGRVPRDHPPVWGPWPVL